MKYDPDIGIFGLDVNVVVERPGHRVQRRRHASSKLPMQHRVSGKNARLGSRTPLESQSWRSNSMAREHGEGLAGQSDAGDAEGSAG